ncbi:MULTISPECIES: S24 family peptidase [unclassified Novosphingobium]|uniref:XRE family transcriptional regulator n=1 Tax=unclassified Novosphingobium TaxID=2644732 RepID=UPI000D31ECDF|nr:MULTISPECIES: S24 family peptidase [unclassified Novosphingobium]PTR05190.1 phage repressor protein C with HTH and peptisase S24 domain [Novosphingobium sp. GV055]PUA93754.1 phage repressor protein C with HTH and peptisase S24 domain [Novosphingobium sp. GV061]PUB10568.1 phage repressor protein C with HTH and peptisase S24 domain [Novosphingobium sp. GV079]PUB36457.1 phage repressor protein C with HTH and peptisase S24 domain [Novosphingobium sp. GV027]
MNCYSVPYNRSVMWEIVPENLIAAMQRAGMNQSQLASAVGVKQPSIGRLISGETKTTRALDQIAAVLGTSAAYLKGQTDDPQRAASEPMPLAAVAVPNADMVEIAEFNLAYGLGGTYIHDAPVQQVLRPFSRAWVRQFTQSPIEQLFWATSSGTSMMPAILDSDILLIDTGQQTPRMWDHVWAIEMHGLGMIKALRPGKEGAMRILSLNPDYPEEVAYDGEMNVIGRVVAIVRKI